jgi:hypothetical protein
MQRKTIAIPAVLVALALLTAGAYADTAGDTPTTTWGCNGYGPAALTDEQQKAVLEKHLELIESGLTREEIHAEMQEFRAELGITGPNFVDEDGDGVCDHAGEGYKGKGQGRGQGGCGTGTGGGKGYGRGSGHMGRW